MKAPRLDLRLMVKLALTVAILAVVTRQVDWALFWESVQTVRVPWLVAVTLSAALDRTWMAGKWWYLLSGMGVRVPYSHTLRHYLVGGLVGMAVQWQLGGDISRAVGLGQSTGRRQVIFASVFVEKVTGAAANGLLATIGLALLIGGVAPASARPVLAGGLVFTLAAACSPLLLVAGPLLRPLRPWRIASSIACRRSRRLTEKLDLAPVPASVWMKFYALTLGEQVIPIVNMIFLNQAFDAGVELGAIFLIMPVIGFFSRLPVSLESVGVKEGLYVYLFGLFGLAPAVAFAMSLTARVIDLLVISTGSLALLALGRRDLPVDPLCETDPNG